MKHLPLSLVLKRYNTVQPIALVLCSVLLLPIGTTAFTVQPPTTIPMQQAQLAFTRNNHPGLRQSLASSSSSSSSSNQEDDQVQEEAAEAIIQAQNATTTMIVEELKQATVQVDYGTSPVSAAVTEEEEKLTAAQNENNDNAAITEAPPLSFSKFLTMQGKRVIVTIRYSGEAGLKPYFLTAAKKIKASHPDVILERRQMADLDKEDPTAEPSFEILVDGKVVVGSNKSRMRKKIGNVDLSWSRSIFVSMQELDLAISRARRRRRPSTTVYGEVHEPTDLQNPLRLDGLRQGSDISVVKRKSHEWND